MENVWEPKRQRLQRNDLIQNEFDDMLVDMFSPKPLRQNPKLRHMRVNDGWSDRGFLFSRNRKELGIDWQGTIHKKRTA